MLRLFSDEQKAALDEAAGRVVQAVHEPSGTRYLLVAAAKRPGEDDMSVAERHAWYALASETCGRAGWDDPIMDEDDNYDENYRKRFGRAPDPL